MGLGLGWRRVKTTGGDGWDCSFGAAGLSLPGGDGAPSRRQGWPNGAAR